MAAYIGGVYGQDMKIHFTCSFQDRDEVEKNVAAQAQVARARGQKVATFVALLEEF